jgi:bacterioferritin (cytochrome b1)
MKGKIFNAQEVQTKILSERIALLEAKMEFVKDCVNRALLKSQQHRSENAVDILEKALKILNNKN